MRDNWRGRPRISLSLIQATLAEVQEHLMALAEKTWTRISVHEFVLEFLRSEEGRLSPGTLPALLNSPDLSNPSDNHQRLRLLYVIRRWLIGEIPLDTEWYRVDSLTDNELHEIHGIARCGLDEPNGRDKNELFKVAKRIPEPLTKHPSTWHNPILWGHDKKGPFTIVDGNHRLRAYASNDQQGVRIPVIIGLSPTPFFFHIFDRCGFIANDLWKSN